MASAEPDPPAAFDAAQMLGYLAEVDELLVQAGTAHALHLFVAGGAVIAAKTDSRLTGDVDVVSEGMTPQLRAAVEEVSQRHRGLRSDWLNDGAKLKRVNVPVEPERIFTGRRLIVDSVGDRYVLAMKLLSHRHVDEADCEMLIRSLGITSQAELLDLIEQANPAQDRSPAAAYFAADRLDNAYRSRRGLRRSDGGLSL
ncbi:MAG: hypothetical protein F4110_10025 [Acidimicrobiaceae bacterium]|nr:hypothetical protein [Acidimicrobiaceae bacterium]MXZ98566.1 hypothetical protein [Acidimicrobiaceae bacterium]MYE75348.1 hypothetical protein [Acidimicrobiaceae bacterium]MYE97524.1 hypothetical protein [Acidimicrobiaceae bacterium]MYH43700.1 hypothetical protein [Acidimicrobiaceae bacterium]